MLTDAQLQSLTETAKTSPDIKMLLDFYLDAQKDGVEIVRLSLNSELLALSKKLENKSEDHYWVYEKIMETSKVLKRLPKPPKPPKPEKRPFYKVQKKQQQEKVVI